MPQQLQKYNVLVAQYSSNQKVDVDNYCNGWTAINIGSTLVEVNGIPLNPGTPGTNNGESYSVGGNKDEVFHGRIDINFPNGPGNVLIIQKYYIP